MKKWFVEMIVISGCIIGTQKAKAQSKLYVPQNKAQEWITDNPQKSEDVQLMKKIAETAQGIWVVGENLTHVEQTIADAGAKKEIPLFILYNIPGRDNGNYSKGGLSGPSAYKAHVEKLSAIIESIPTIIVVEPDALGLARDLKDPVKKKERYEMIADAVSILHAKPQCKVFIDIARWLGMSEDARVLKAVGIDKADGFSLNTSGYDADEKVIAFGNELSALVGKPFIVDTSRNGNGGYKSTEKDPWCNPPGRALGRRPTLESGLPHVYAFLWTKRPGESDGECRGGPAAGVFWPERALELARNAKW